VRPGIRALADGARSGAEDRGDTGARLCGLHGNKFVGRLVCLVGARHSLQVLLRAVELTEGDSEQSASIYGQEYGGLTPRLDGATLYRLSD
jgi:hypothetical protein